MSTFSEIIQSEKPVLVDFYADWCGPCKMMTPILHEVKETLGEEISIIKIDVDKNQPLAAQLQVRSIPTLMLYQKGQQLWKTSGVMSQDQLVAIIKEKSL